MAYFTHPCSDVFFKKSITMQKPLIDFQSCFERSNLITGCHSDLFNIPSPSFFVLVLKLRPQKRPRLNSHPTMSAIPCQAVEGYPSTAGYPDCRQTEQGDTVAGHGVDEARLTLSKTAERKKILFCICWMPRYNTYPAISGTYQSFVMLGIYF